MTDAAERYRRLSADFAEKVAKVDPARWAAPSPCTEWTARDVVRHVVDTHGMFLGLVGRELGAVPSVDEDPLAAFLVASARVQHDLDDPALAGETFDGFFGTTRFDTAIDRFISMDLVIHGWDVARATGQDTTMRAEEVERIATVDVPAFGEALRAPGIVGPEVSPPADASAQDRLLAVLGRHP